MRKAELDIEQIRAAIRRWRTLKNRGSSALYKMLKAELSAMGLWTSRQRRPGRQAFRAGARRNDWRTQCPRGSTGTLKGPTFVPGYEQ